MYICSIAHPRTAASLFFFNYFFICTNITAQYIVRVSYCDDCYISHARNDITKNQQRKISWRCPVSSLLGEGYITIIVATMISAKYYHYRCVILSLCCNSVVNVLRRVCAYVRAWWLWIQACARMLYAFFLHLYVHLHA